MQLDDALIAVANGVEKHGFVLAILDSLYNFSDGGYDLKDEQAASMIIKAKTVCDETGCSIMFVDHMPWPAPGAKADSRARAYGSVFKNAASRYGLYLAAADEDGKAWFSARGNNVAGHGRQLAVLDKTELRWKLVEGVESLSDDQIRQATLDAVQRIPGIGKVELRRQVGGNAQKVDDMVGQLIDEGLIRLEVTGRTHRHYPAEPPETANPDDLEWK